MKKVVVLGSINMDLVTLCEKAPRGGETLLGREFFQIPGGKGANQAVAIGKLGGEVSMLGKVGKDSMGDELLKSMKESNVNIENIERSEFFTGVAQITLEKHGENRIVVVPGANYDVDKEYIDKNINIIKNCDILVAQLEIPLETVKYAFSKAKEFNKVTILNPAPAVHLDEEVIKNSDYIIPNETELEVITGIDTKELEGVKKAAKSLLNKGVTGLLVTLGSQGAMIIDNNEETLIPAHKVKAVDTTAAGDSFIGGFVRGISDNQTIDESIALGVKVAAIAVTRLGAQTSIPTMDEVLEFRGEN
ncbi:ribokinase [uncultured Cetobacterium sp.]|uniref:ribokinase n=1 Tax=uncultured Cetobacterium sp. TaxID=527638 RepID=UPI00262D693B|nr:ribokinase [uncultured Cetobacterium sp.]